MATAGKRKGAPASAGPVRRDGKPTRKEKRVLNKARHAEIRAEVESKMGPPARKGGGAPLVVKDGDKPRPTVYDQELATEICTRFATDPTMSLSKLNLDPRYPIVMTFYQWLEQSPELARLYARAREAQLDVQAEDMRETAANALEGKVRTRRQAVTKHGDIVDLEEERTADNVERAKLMISTQQWLLARLRPRKYGVQVDPAANQPNDQLKALFDSLKSGPAE